VARLIFGFQPLIDSGTVPRSSQSYRDERAAAERALDELRITGDVSGSILRIRYNPSIMLKNWSDKWLWRLASHLKFVRTDRTGSKVTEPRYTYTVLVDDNYHSGDESERYTSGTFPSLEAAIEACKYIVDEFLEESCKGIEPSSDALYKHYVAFGPDPFIVTNAPSMAEAPFSAWTYAREQCVRRFGNPKTPEPSNQD
jgi:hypothetical protein